MVALCQCRQSNTGPKDPKGARAMTVLRHRYFAVLVASLALSLALAQGNAFAGDGGNVCIGRNGDLKVQRGTATCSVQDTSDATAIGDGAHAGAHTDGSARAIGDGAEAIAKDNSTAFALGTDADANAEINSAAVAMGDGAVADAYHESTALATGQDAVAIASYDSTAIADGAGAVAEAELACTAEALGDGATDSCP
jgi:hypothetical protein